jgi:hypothetical protein
MMMMETPKLRKFWALAKKAISKNEKVIRRWLWERYGVWSPHDLKLDDQEAVLAKLEMMADGKDEKITFPVWRPDGQVLFCPQIDELLKDFAKRRNWQWRYTTPSGRKIVKDITPHHLATLYQLLAYFTPCHIHELAELLGRIAAAVRRNGEPETFAAIETFFQHDKKLRKKKRLEPHQRLPIRYLNRLIRRIYGARKRMWEKMLREDLAENIAAVAFGAFRQASYEATKEAAERQRRQSTRN